MARTESQTNVHKNQHVLDNYRAPLIDQEAAASNDL